jgi:hypothetical protein
MESMGRLDATTDQCISDSGAFMFRAIARKFTMWRETKSLIVKTS